MVIHPSAIVDPGAELASDVEIGPFSVIGPDVVLGAGTRVESHVVIEGPTRIGAGNRIHSFSTLGGAPQDKKYHGEPSAWRSATATSSASTVRSTAGRREAER